MGGYRTNGYCFCGGCPWYFGTAFVVGVHTILVLLLQWVSMVFWIDAVRPAIKVARTSLNSIGYLLLCIIASTTYLDIHPFSII